MSSVVGWIAWRRGSLSDSGVVGAITTGTITTAAGGYGYAALLIGFFGTSSGVSKLRPTFQPELTSYAAKGSARDLKQVLANGGVSTLITLLARGSSNRLAYIGSLAAATGDTWATEIGGRYGGQPRHVLTLEQVPTGYSGGVSGVGVLASAIGGVFIGSLAMLTGKLDPAFRTHQRQPVLLTGILSGLIGSLADSLIGATLQERRYCDQCGQLTERVQHTCGHRTRIIGGIPGLDNDGVNLLGTLAGAVTGWAISWWQQ